MQNTEDQNNTEDYNQPIVEPENIGSTSIMEKPFDPKKIDIKHKNLSIDLLVKRLKAPDPEIDLYPDFQRKENLWDDVQQSLLIESILISFPLPAFYFDGTEDNKWLVVDGLQRLSSLKNFMITKTLKLTGLEFLNQFENESFDSLPRAMQRKIEESQIVAYIINPGTPPEVKFNIFKRINTGGLILTPQEIRHAMNQGIPAKFIAELSKLPEFISATRGKISSDRMLDREFVTRFITFYLSPASEYSPDLDTYMNKKMSELANLPEENLMEIKFDFQKSMTLTKDVFSDYAFRKVFDLSEKKKPINKALFEVWSVGFAKLSSDERGSLLRNKRLLFDSFIHLMNNDEKFVESITSATGDKTRIIYRFKKIYEVIKKTLEI